MPVPQFPPGFLWGASASAFQTEGAVDADGKGPSGWDAFAALPGRIKDGTDTTRGTGFHARYREDVALLSGLGADAFRFSISWPRVVPGGSGAVNADGLDFYDRLVDELCAHGITPAPTLYHWDTPLPLEETGGWLDRDTAYRFAEYAGIVAERLADRVPMWITINEPAEVTMLGYALGEHAPGRALLFDALPAAHHQLLAHGLAVRALRAAGADNIGIALSHAPVWTAGDSDEDRFGAELYDTLTNWLFADPVLTGRYPDDGLAALMPGPVSDDLKVISTPLDWYGVNYYNPTLVGAPGRRPWRPSPASRCPPDSPSAYARSRGTRKPASAGPSSPRASPRSSPCCTAATATASRRSTSPRTAAPWTSRSPTTDVSPTWRATSPPCARRWTPGSTYGGTSPGRSPTTWSGRRGPRSGSAWCTSTTRPSPVRRRPRTPGTAT